MTASHTKNLDIYTAKQVKSSATTSNVYLTFGKSSAWANESSPLQANSSIINTNDIWKNMIGAKRIYGNNIRHAIPRVDWTSGTVYTAYSDQQDSLVLNAANNHFYVLTSENHVFKCLYNNGGAGSTVMPNILVTTTHFQTSDGYIWKYMYSLNAEELLRFVTPTFIPVKTLVDNDNSQQWNVQKNAIDGAIHIINVTNAGSNYTANDVSVKITGDGKFANAYAVLDTSAHSVKSIVVDNLGYGYTYATVTLTSAVGYGATATAVMSPPGGHGSDALSELGGSYLVFNMQFKDSENGILTTHNDYRQIAMVENPLSYGTSNVCSTPVLSQLTTLTLNGTSVEYAEDEWVYQGSTFNTAAFKGYVTEWDSSNNIIKLSQTEGTPTKDLLIGVNTSAGRFVSLITNPGLQPRSGHLLYTDNITAIQRANDQAEDYRIVLNF